MARPPGANLFAAGVETDRELAARQAPDTRAETRRSPHRIRDRSGRLGEPGAFIDTKIPQPPGGPDDGRGLGDVANGFHAPVPAGPCRAWTGVSRRDAISDLPGGTIVANTPTRQKIPKNL